jgi:hypothetical protein
VKLLDLDFCTSLLGIGLTINIGRKKAPAGGTTFRHLTASTEQVAQEIHADWNTPSFGFMGPRR